MLVRVWLPDRPGALGLVASRIGAVRGDIVGVDVLELGDGVAVDEFALDLPSADLVPILVREIEEVDGASVEEVRLVSHFPDPRLDALESAARLCQVTAEPELYLQLVSQVRSEFLAEWAALVVADVPGAAEPSVLGSSGDAPGGNALVALASGLAASPLVASGQAGPEDLASAPLPAHRAILLVSREGYIFRQRERAQLVALARIADQLWTLLESRAVEPKAR